MKLRRGSWLELATVLICSLITLLSLQAETPPDHGNFYSLQLTNSPPLPYDPFPEKPFYSLGGDNYLYDDRDVDYNEISAQNMFLDFLSEDFSPSMVMSSSLSSSYAYGNPVYLTNLVAAVASNKTVTASFDIQGGTNFVPYDILVSTNVASPAADWSWIRIGYTSNRYTFVNQPFDSAFYLLAKPREIMVVAWGDDGLEQSTVPAGLTNAVAVAGGQYHSLALLDSGKVTGWGNNYYGQISVPTNVTTAAMIAAGSFNSLALLTNGTVAAWGLHWPALGYTLTEVPSDLTNATVIAAAALHALALRSNGMVVAWGYNPAGETNVPVDLSNVVAIAAGDQHCLAAKSDGTVVAWGLSTSGQCSVPAGLSNAVDVAAGARHSLALRSDGTVVPWGGLTNVPADVTNIVAIAAGGNSANGSSYSLALKSDNTVAIWGASGVVRTLGGFSNVVSLANGADHALAIRTGPRTPVITLEPTDQYQIAGGNLTFTSRGAGLYGVSYQWKTNGVNLTGATNASHALTNAQAAQAVDYTVTVSNEVGSITSPNAHLYLVGPPVIIWQTLPANQVGIFNENRTLSVTATGVGESAGFPLGYQWRLNGTNISGATSTSYTLFVASNSIGDYTVVVTNAGGSATAAWQVELTNAGSYVDVGTLAFHLSTNAVGFATGYTSSASNTVELIGWSPATYYGTNMAILTNSIWSTNFWLKGLQGLSATCIGFSNAYGGLGLITMVSPRHCLYATHMHTNTETFMAAFLDTNNLIHWRTRVQQVDLGYDTSVGIMDSDLPASVGFLPVVPTNLPSYLPTNSASYVQGIGMNKALRVFSQPMTFGSIQGVGWISTGLIPFGLGTNWSDVVCCGDSSAPERLLIGNQLVLASHNTTGLGGPNYAFLFGAINQRMHYLSTNNGVGSDYQLTPFAVTNWPALR